MGGPWAFQSIGLQAVPGTNPFFEVVEVKKNQSIGQVDVKQTRAQALNNKHEIVGFYDDAVGGGRHGFRRNPDGSMDCFDVILESGPADSTSPYGINVQGFIVGQYTSGDITGGFQCSPFLKGGTGSLGPKDFLTWQVTAGMLSSEEHLTWEVVGTTFSGINNSARITGFYDLNKSGSLDTRHGFTLTGGSGTKLGKPVWLRNRNLLEPWGISQSGDLAGTTDPTESLVEGADGEGFLMQAKDILKTQIYDPICYPNALFTTARGSDSKGHVVGFYSATKTYAQVIDDGRGFIAIRSNVPGGPPEFKFYQKYFQPNTTEAADDVRIQDINEPGEMVGFYRVKSQWNGFLIKAAHPTPPRG